MTCLSRAQEVLRMYPPVGIGQIRVAEKHDIVLGGRLHIPAGTIMWVGSLSLKHMAMPPSPPKI